MKKILSIALVAFLILSSCKKECSVGFEGKDCKTEVKESFVGNYKGALITSNNQYTVIMQVSDNSSDATELKIDVFNVKIYSNEGSFYIPAQVVNINGFAYDVYGNGYFTDNSVSMQYTLSRNGTDYAYWFSGVKEI